MVSPQKTYQVAVIGAGPAGLAAVGKLLDMNVSSILWVDKLFEAGRLSCYKSVPSNTKVKLFVGYATQYESFRKIWQSGQFGSLKALKTADAESGCKLGLAANMVKDLVKGLSSNNILPLKCLKDELKSLSFNNGTWSLKLASGDLFEASKVILATGSHPLELALPASTINVPLDDVLDSSVIESCIEREDTVAVIGSSHSAMLVLKILSELPAARKPQKVLNFYRAPLKFAEYLPDGRIKHDNTGLKGEVADWVRLNLKDCSEGQVQSVQFDGFIDRYNLSAGEEAQIYCDTLPHCTKVVSAIGYERNQLPDITISDKNITPTSYDDYGQLMNADGTLIPCLYGVGIAFPARVDDVDGTLELAVGLWKFIKHIDQVMPRIWKQQ